MFHRSTRKLTLTPEGEIWLASCLRIQEELEQAQQLLRHEQQEPIGQVKLSLPTTFGRTQILPILLKLSQQYPQLSYQIYFQDHLVDMLVESVDIAVRFGTLTDLDNIIAKPIACYQNKIAASPLYLVQSGKPHHPNDLIRHHCLSYSGQAQWTLLNEQGEPQKYPIYLYHQINDGDALIQSALNHQGIVQLPDWLLPPHIQQGNLVEILSSYANPPQTIHVLWQKKYPLQPKIKVVVEALQKIQLC